MRHIPALAIAAAAVLAFSACGGDAEEADDPIVTDDDAETDETDESNAGDDPDRQAYLDVAVAAFDGQLPIDPEAVECFAGAFIDAIGVDNLVEAGVSPEELNEADSLDELGVEVEDGATDRAAENLGDCEIDYASILATVAADGEAASPEAIECLEGELDSDALDRALAGAFVSTLTGEEPGADLPTLGQPAIAACAAELGAPAG